MESTFHKKVRLRCDNEPAAKIIAERVKALLPDIVMLENTPRHDHAANPAERAIRSVEDQVRVLRLDVEARYWDPGECQHVIVAMDCETRGMALDEVQDQG